MRRWKVGGVGAILALLLVYFFALAEPPNSGSENRANLPRTRCVTAGQQLLDEIAANLNVQGGGSLRDGFVVKSEDYEKVWFVAAEIDGPGLESRGDVGIWATNELNGSSLILSADAMAREFSDWFYGPDTEFAVSQFDDGAEEARSCQEARE